MTAVFISDLHLRIDNPLTIKGFIRFLDTVVSKAKVLYILGDFFDYYIGDDDCNLLYEIIVNALIKLHNKKILCYFIHGNRDFLLNKQFAKASNILLLPYKKVIYLYNKNIFITHGDIFCMNDISYQYYRKFIHNCYIQKIFLSLPLFMRHYIAKKMRFYSKHVSYKTNSNRFDINQNDLNYIYKTYNVNYIIHGHTHCPSVYKININGEKVYRYVLGAWEKHGYYVKVSKDFIKLCKFYF
uniref:UDP-2,3-diacylglucosamine hydrolase n=1 Tax=Candidatus Aschnera chinzeii TaxID=1485666 RepID=A0AAT9G3S5_9ENTR|nr:MAG: UDP-2,3-diacylglucosamine diphosphatase [Candidatus Aschnera chinzeii]